MILINIAALIIAVAVVVLVIALIPLIRELKESSIALREFVVKVESDIHPTIKELHAVLADLEVITAGAADKVEDVKHFMSAVGETGKGLRTISTVVSGIAGTVANSSVWLTGAKVAGSYLLEKLLKKGGK
jgi:uncharacterized protein YoxC